MNHNFPCSPEGGKISQLNNIILYHANLPVDCFLYGSEASVWV